MKSIIIPMLTGAMTASLATTTGSVNAATPAPSAHVAWCEQHYRSYNARTDTYIGFDSVAHGCVSPFVSGGLFATTGPAVPALGDTVSGRPKNPNGLGSGTPFRLYPNDSDTGNNGTSGGP